MDSYFVVGTKLICRGNELSLPRKRVNWIYDAAKKVNHAVESKCRGTSQQDIYVEATSLLCLGNEFDMTRGISHLRLCRGDMLDMSRENVTLVYIMVTT